MNRVGLSGSRVRTGPGLENGYGDDMFYSAKGFYGYEAGTNGEQIGKVNDIFFDGKEWRIRYLVINSGGERRIIAPCSIGLIDCRERSFCVLLSRKQIDEGPGNFRGSLSRTSESEIADYYGWPRYWEKEGGGDDPPELISAWRLVGIPVQAGSREIGLVADLLINGEEWQIAFLAVKTSDEAPGKRLMVEPVFLKPAKWETGTSDRLFIDAALEEVYASSDKMKKEAMECLS